MERISYQDIPSGMFESLMAVEAIINKSTIDFKLLELMRLRVAQLNGCAYCVDMHYKELKNSGESELRLSSLCVWQETPYFLERERVVLEFTEEVTNVQGSSISDKLFQTLLTHFDKPEISLLTLAVAQINTWTRLMKTFGFTPGNYQLNTDKANKK